MHSAGEEDFGQEKRTTTPLLSQKHQHKGKVILVIVSYLTNVSDICFMNTDWQLLTPFTHKKQHSRCFNGSKCAKKKGVFS